MITYEILQQHESVFRTMTGLSPEEFRLLAADVLPRYAQAEEKRLTQRERKRALGGGDRPALETRDQLLLTLVWMRLYLNYRVLGFLFGVSAPTVTRYLSRMLPVLKQLGRDEMRMPDPGRQRRRSLPDLLAEIPELAVVVDSFEQTVQRPNQREEWDAWYSGKKKALTVKSQVSVDENTGLVVDVSPSVPGRVADISLLKQSHLLQQLPPDAACLADAAYQGIATLHPKGYSPYKPSRHGPLTQDQHAYNHAFASRRIIVENTLCRMRTFQCLTQRDRSHRQLGGHTLRVYSVACLVNRRIRSVIKA